MKDILNIDFNALQTLRLVLRLGSFSAAADALDVKQSTVSYTIDRLRKALDDPLIIRQGGKNVPTVRCQEISPIIERILVDADRIENSGTFDPAQSNADVVIVVPTTVTSVLLPKMFRRILNEAPNISVTIEIGIRDVIPPLLQGRADLAIVYNKVEANGIYEHRDLAHDYPVCIMDPNNPLTGKTLTVEDLSKAKHVGARLWSGWRQPYIVAAEEMGATINEVLVVNDQLSVPQIIRGTDLIGGMPNKLANVLRDQVGVAYFPFKIDLVMNMYWPAASNGSPLNRWLREIAIDEAKRI